MVTTYGRNSSLIKPSVKMYASRKSVGWQTTLISYKVPRDGEKRIEQNAIYAVKLPLLQARWAEQRLILPLENWLYFFFGPWLFMYQFVEIYNQIESTDETWKHGKKYF